ncbi:hypothetical protein [Paenibacillus sp. FSL R5-0701]|uniref:hypothetical protein n=1 Tax=Paenibacillus sp. FSL R5-0701 TaxID=2921654 RepID=UPI0030CA9587
MNEPTLKKAMDTLEFLSQDREARRLYEERQSICMTKLLWLSGLTESEIQSLKG